MRGDTYDFAVARRFPPSRIGSWVRVVPVFIKNLHLVRWFGSEHRLVGRLGSAVRVGATFQILSPGEYLQVTSWIVFQYRNTVWTLLHLRQQKSWISFVAELESLETRRNNLSRSLFQDICKPTSRLYHLIPLPRDTSVITRLRPTTPLPLPTKK